MLLLTNQSNKAAAIASRLMLHKTLWLVHC